MTFFEMVTDIFRSGGTAKLKSNELFLRAESGRTIKSCRMGWIGSAL
jgi:hypothetical protein